MKFMQAPAVSAILQLVNHASAQPVTVNDRSVGLLRLYKVDQSFSCFETPRSLARMRAAGHVSSQMLRKVYAHVRLPALRSAVDSIGSVAIVRADNTGLPVKEGITKPHQTLFRVAEMAEQLGIEGDKALQLLIEYKRQQALAKGKK